ncbi:protein of unknown function [Moritella yayanosii]|uniref:Uncharacterized protein n=1 Tax=Moritella yayanosii TaxID=69539 RepID=A0A330LPD0_9GAMM|nr:protein of unknown function [Moritella yayanosii]
MVLPSRNYVNNDYAAAMFKSNPNNIRTTNINRVFTLVILINSVSKQLD